MLRINKVMLAGLLVGTMALPGCAAAGGVANEGAKSVLELLRSDPEKSLRTAVDKSADVKSVAFTFSGKETGDPVELTGKAQFGAKPAAELRVVEQGKPMTILLHGDVIHVAVPAEDAATFQGKKWLKMDMSKLSEKDTKELGASPAEFSKMLNELNPKSQLQQMIDVGEFKVAGDDTIGGAKTVHYTSTIKAEKFLAAHLPAERAAVEKKYKAAAVKDVTFDIWLDEKYELRKAKLLAGTVDDWTATYTDHNVPVALTVPPAAEVLDFAALMAQLKKAQG